MGEPEDATARYAAALRALHEAAGSPTSDTITRQAQAQRPPLKVPSSTWSNWRNGESVPSNSAIARWLIEDFLRPRARQHTPSFVTEQPQWWEDARRMALAQRRQGGRPPAPYPPALPAEGAGVRCRVGVVPQAADCFQDREIALRLAQAADGGEIVVLSQAPPEVSPVLTGMGGVGKTQLAAAYARRAWQQQEVRVLVWVSAMSRPQIVATYAQAAAALGLRADAKDDEEAARGFLAWAQTAPVPWLVVLDDVQDPADARQLWPCAEAGAGPGRVVVTTRRRDAALAGPGRIRVDVDVFTPAEARHYLTAKLAAAGCADTVEQIDALAADLGHLPLALAQATAYLIDTGLDCAAYRERLADRARTVAELVPDDSSLPDDHRTIVAATWSLSIDRADRARPVGLARPLLQVAAVLGSNGIPQAALTSLPVLAYLTERRPLDAAGENPRGLSAADAYDGLRVLHRFSLLDHDPNASFQEVRVHQLIQRATRDNLAGVELVTTAHAAADALMVVWPDIERDQLGPILRANTGILHALTGTALWEWNGQAHPVLFRAGNSFGDTGQVSEAVAEYTRLRITATRLLGPDHPATLTARHNLAGWRGVAGDPAGAAAAFKELLVDQLRILGPDHPNTLASRGSLADWRGVAGDPAGAAATYEEVLADFLRVLGSDHPDTLTARHNLALWWGRAGDPAGAVAAFEELLVDRVRVLGSDHPETLASRGSLAGWWGRAGDPAGAVAAFEELLVDRVRVLGSDHP
ncbi:tetratricopeptide repeat protein, partial [Streptosporangium canum]|uniref:tetratricopeptide repeat protein n=1 Tax=Streptosporangium canum TaxID=324952 RepID=UPI0036B7E4EA